MKTYLSILFLALLSCNIVKANDGVYFTSGSFLIPVKETDISAKKEILTITICNDGFAQVDVQYYFNNNTDKDKTVTMAFEAQSPYNAGDPLSTNYEHPHISDFTVNMNGKPLQHRNALVALHYDNGTWDSDHMPLDRTQWKCCGEVADSILPEYDLLYNEALDSVCNYAYAYYFDATFHPGINTVHHTYRYRMSYRVGCKFDIPYWLTPVTRWANGQVDDFTLSIKARDYLRDNADIVIEDSVFLGTDVEVLGIQTPVYRITPPYSGHCIFTTISPSTTLQWHLTNFAPKSDMRISSGDCIYSDPIEYATTGKVVIEKDGHISRYLADADDGYFVSVQDYGIVPREGARIETYSAENGQGIVYLNSSTKAANVRTEPSVKSKVLCVISDEEGDLPNTYPCLGLVLQQLPDCSYKEWFKIKVNGKIGYVSRQLMIWDSICTF